MAPQTSIPVAANVLSTIGTVLWCIQLIPQVFFNWRRKKTDGLPGSMMLIWAICAVPFGAYAIIQNFAIAIQIQPQAFGFLALVNWAQTLYYHDSWRGLTTSLTVLFCVLLFAGVEVALVLTLRKPYEGGVTWPITLIGAIAAVLLACGLLPPYREIWRRRGRVIGISWIFLTIDWLGALFSLLAIVAQQSFDPLGGVLYIIVLAFEAAIFLSHAIWLLRTRKLHREAKAAGVEFDELSGARKYQYP